MVGGYCLNFGNSPILFSFLLYMHLESNRMHIGFLDLLTQSYWKETGTPKSPNFLSFFARKSRSYDWSSKQVTMDKKKVSK